jgi:S1-C subfamily serine protease
VVIANQQSSHSSNNAGASSVTTLTTVAGGAKGAGNGAGNGANQPSTPLVEGNQDEPAAAVAEALGPSVVQIETGQGLGSGVVYDKRGLILTNAHVVQGATKLTVRLQDGSTLDGQVLGADTQADVAVVRVQADEPLPVARLAQDKPKVGQMAIAIGSPFGLQESVTAGIISAVSRPVGGESGGITIEMIQTDAPINPGNSGGALANRKGEVTGINSSIYSQSGENNGIGFAIPISTAKAIADKIVNGEPLDHAYLGVATRPPTDGQSGAVVANVTAGSPAAKAGLQSGDLVIAVDGDAVKDPQDLSARIVSHSPGDSVSLDVRHRDGSTTTVTVQLGTRPAELDNQSGQSQGQGGQGRGGHAAPGDPFGGEGLVPQAPGQGSGGGSSGGSGGSRANPRTPGE